MLRIYASVLAALVVATAAIAVRIPNEGLGLSVLYVGSSCVLAYAGFRRGGRRRSYEPLWQPWALCSWLRG